MRDSKGGLAHSADPTVLERIHASFLRARGWFSGSSEPSRPYEMMALVLSNPACTADLAGLA